jgi:hypothetical protein
MKLGPERFGGFLNIPRPAIWRRLGNEPEASGICGFDVT